MKRTLSVLFALLLTGITASAQIQNGYVRSQGTSYNRTGSPLKGARVFVKGLNGSKVTATNGTFNFNLGGGKTQFSINTVTLKGYTLLAPLPPAYNVGKATVEIVMQSREERIQNEARISKIIEERITKSYDAKTKELQKKIADLEKALSDKKRNSNELESQIRSLKEQMGNLDNQYMKRNELIDKMVEEYVNLDYATMNNRKAELCSYIESGELEKADSLLNTIDIYKEMNDIKTLNRDIEEKESMLEKEKEICKNKIETACMYWRGKYNIAIQNMQYDSAAVYIRNLADVDTCNFENVFDCANYLREQNYFKEAEEYYNKILKTGQEKQLISKYQIAGLYNNLAVLYYYTQRFKESEEMYKDAIHICERLAKENPKVYEKDLATSYNNLANLYSDTQRFKESEEMNKTAIQIRERLAKENQKVYEKDLAMSYNNLAVLYRNTQRFKESEEMDKAAIQIRERLAKENPKAYEKDLAMSYNNLAALYSDTQRFKESEEMYKATIQIYERLAKENLKVYEKDLARSYNNLALLYSDTQRFKESEEMYKAAIQIYERLTKENPKVYESDLATSYNNLVVLYRNTQRFKESEEMLKAAIQIYERLAKENLKVYESDLATSYNNLAALYSDTQRFKESEEMHKTAIQIRERLAKENPKVYEKDLARSYDNLANIYRETQRFKESEEMLKATIQIYDNLANIYRETQRFKESEEMLKAAIQIYERLAKENPKAYESDLARSYNNLALLYSNTQRLKESEEVLKAAIQIYERLYNNNPQEYQGLLAFNYYCLGTLMTENNKQDDAIEAFEHSVKLSKELIKEDDFKQIYLFSLPFIVTLHQQVGNNITAYTYNEEYLSLLKNLYEEDTEKWKSSYFEDLIQQSYLANLLGKFKDGERYSLEALKIDPNYHLAYTNLAASLLLQGRLEEAEKLFRAYKAELKDEFLNDLAKFESLRVIPEERKADVERIKAILSE